MLTGENLYKIIKNNLIMVTKELGIDDILLQIDIEIAKKGWKRTHLVRAMNKTDGWLSKIMNKERGLSVPLLLEIAKALKISPASLFISNKNKLSQLSLGEVKKIIREEIRKSK